MDYLPKQNYIEIRLMELYSNFISRARKINAQINFYLPSLIIYKDGKYLRLNFYLKNQSVLNRKTLGYVEISFGGLVMKTYLTEDFEWVINIENTMLKKISSAEVDYVFYKTYEVW